MGKLVDAKGMRQAENAVKMLADMGARTRGIELPGHAREVIIPGGPTNNGEIVDLLDKGGRDITPNQDDCDAAAKVFVKMVEVAVKRAIKTPGTISPSQAGILAARAWRRSGYIVMQRMKGRLEANLCSDGSYRPVSPGYAAWRNREYKIPPSVVFRATGQLIANLSGSPNTLRLIR
ncbi:MAG: hypothetical protein GY854_01825 [Deltaproteobacteria bacterium]|nr:hypothetical protein [Deltaproteobacteria bacterium]